MRHPAIEPLLILQEREKSRRTLTQQLGAVPAEKAREQARIEAERQAIETARTECRELETRQKLLETEIGSMEDQLARYRTQQSLVKKNDEYQALGHEIDTTQEKISQLEEQELEVMYEIDAAQERYVQTGKDSQDNIAGHEKRLATLDERACHLTAELEKAGGACKEARGGLDARSLRLFDQVAQFTTPACVVVDGGKCGGCHLKVSGEAEDLARKGEELSRCDQCGRILWWENS